MKWTEPAPPTEGISYYDHVLVETPLGRCIIEWKSWKRSDSYTIFLADEFIGVGLNLEDAKRIAKDWFLKKHNKLSEVLNLPCKVTLEKTK